MKTFALAAALLVLGAAPTAKEPAMLRFGTDVKPSPAASGDKGEDPAPLEVGTATAKLSGQKLLGELVVTNTSDKPVRIVVNPYGGGFPYGGTSPFTFGLGGEPAVKYSGQAYPPAPPRPLTLEFPAKAKVLFTAEIDLANYTWAGAPEISINWGFYFARGKPVEGKVKAQLPKK